MLASRLTNRLEHGFSRTIALRRDPEHVFDYLTTPCAMYLPLFEDSGGRRGGDGVPVEARAQPDLKPKGGRSQP